VFKKNLIESFQMWFKNSFESSKLTVFQENVTFEDKTLKILDEIVEKTNTLNEEIVSLFSIHLCYIVVYVLNYCFLFLESK